MSTENTPQIADGTLVRYDGLTAFVIHGNMPDSDWCPKGSDLVNIRILDTPPSGWSRQQDVYACKCEVVEAMTRKVIGWDGQSQPIARFIRGCGCAYRLDGSLERACTGCVIAALRGATWR